MLSRLTTRVRDYVAVASLAGWYQQLCSAFGAILALPIYSTALGAEQLGVWLTFQTVIGIAGLADFGLSQVLARQVAFAVGRGKAAAFSGAQDIDHTQSGWQGVANVLAIVGWINRRFLLVGVILFLFGASLLVRRIEVSGISADALWIVVLLLMITAALRLIGRPFAAVLDGTGSISTTRFIGGTQQLAMALGGAGIAVLTQNLVTIAIWSVATALLEYLALWEFLRRRTEIGKYSAQAIGHDGVVRILKTAMPMGIVNLGGFLYSSIQAPMIAAALGPSAVGSYYVAQRIAQFFNTASLQLVYPKLPKFTRLLGGGHMEEAARLFKDSVLASSILSSVVSVVFLIAIEPLCLHFFYIPALPQAVGLLMAVDLFFLNVAVAWGHFVLASGRNPLWLPTLIGGVFNVILLTVFVRRYGLIALPISSLLAGMVTFYGASIYCGARLLRELSTYGKAPAQN